MALQIEKKREEDRIPMLKALLLEAVVVSRLASGAGCSVEEAIMVFNSVLNREEIESARRLAVFAEVAMCRHRNGDDWEKIIIAVRMHSNDSHDRMNSRTS